MQDIIDTADELYKTYQTDKLYEHLLPYKDVTDDEVQWRLARVTHDKAKHEKDKQKRHNWMMEAFSYAEKALEMNSNSPHCHRWYGALLYFTTDGIGLKHKIQAAYKVREHFDKALSLDASDVISLHSIGYWCFTFAERPWYQRKIASALFQALPETTYEEALDWFLKAERVQENFMCTNLLMIGKSYLRIHNKEKAVEYLKKAADYHIKTPDDEQDITVNISIFQLIVDFWSQKEAADLLKHMGHGHLLNSCIH